MRGRPNAFKGLFFGPVENTKRRPLCVEGPMYTWEEGPKAPGRLVVTKFIILLS